MDCCLLLLRLMQGTSDPGSIYPASASKCLLMRKKPYIKTDMALEGCSNSHLKSLYLVCGGRKFKVILLHFIANLRLARATRDLYQNQNGVVQGSKGPTGKSKDLSLIAGVLMVGGEKGLQLQGSF